MKIQQGPLSRLGQDPGAAVHDVRTHQPVSDQKPLAATVGEVAVLSANGHQTARPRSPKRFGGELDRSPTVRKIMSCLRAHLCVEVPGRVSVLSVTDPERKSPCDCCERDEPRNGCL